MPFIGTYFSLYIVGFFSFKRVYFGILEYNKGNLQQQIYSF